MFGNNVAKIRKQRGYSLSELAELTDISKSYLSNIERNLNRNPSLQIMIKIATVLKVDLVTLLKTGSDEDANLYIEKEWIDFVRELKESGLEKAHIQQYKSVIEFIKWQNEQAETNNG
ncbi:XRE family transcriptional regulator of biofilm formation [Bacillus sp. SORGH_AS 510]|uniref:helix-turn-helix domain-containing protein n=1 Tax=Bacillus sp. SORGH_AS_0510 TaxID=3041771 RepID=UPI0027890F99|nr:helix-turn-helix transcriptional regulator [Bacillus sp. SORGH_AS_0510]MDQ1144583.1 XRE family transcriptional regulator of biofilm formation [Bacillus sp. SORGH_AS_0510]